MQKFKIISVCSIVLMLSILFIINQNSSSKKKNIFSKGEKFAMGIGTKADKFARFTFQNKQMVNPTTGKIPANMRMKEMEFAKTINNNVNKNIEDLDWKARGPYNVGGRTRAFEVDINNENVIVAGSVSGGIWKTTDGGNSWYKVAMNENNLSITDIEQDTRDGHTNEWYYASGELFGASQGENGAIYLGNGIYKSEDSGETWFPLTATNDNSPQTWNSFWERTWDIEIDVSNLDQTELYVGTYASVYRSTNGGMSWQIQNALASTNDDISYFTEIEITNTGIVYAGMSSENEIIPFGLSDRGGVWRSENGGNWINISNSTIFAPQYNRLAIAINPQNENEIYVAASNVTPQNGKLSVTWSGDSVYNALYKYEYLSGDGTGNGGNWTDLTQNLLVGPDLFDDFNCQGGYDLHINIKPDDSNAIFVGGTNLYRSTDGFTSEANVDIIGGYLPGSGLPKVSAYENHHPDQHGLWFSPTNPNVAYSYHDGGISKTENIMEDDVVWTSMNNGYVTTQFYTISIKNNDTSNIILGGLQDNGTRMTTNNEEENNWVRPWGGDGSFSAIPNHGDYIIVSLQSGRIYMLQLNEYGETINYERIDPALPRSDFSFIHPFILDPNNDYTLFTPIKNQLYRNNQLQNFEFTNSWDSTMVGWEVYSDTAFSALDDEFSAIAISKNESNRVYLGTENGKFYVLPDASNLNSMLFDITSSEFPDDAYLKCIAVNPTNELELMVTFTNYEVYSLFYSNDGGGTFSKIAGNLEQFPNGIGNGPSLRWASILPTDSLTHYFVGTSIGLYHTDSIAELNTEWQLMSPDKIGNNIVNMIKTRELDGYIVAATHGNGVFSANTPDNSAFPVTDIKENEIQKALSEIKIYPMPANNFVNVNLHLNKIENVEITVFDEIGRKTNVEKSLENVVGNQTTKLNLSDLSKGIYYVTIKIGKEQITKTIVVN